MIVEDYQIEFQSLRSQVLMPTQKLSRGLNVFFTIETQNYDRQIPTDAVRPESRLRQTVQRQHVRSRTQRRIGVQHAAGESLKEMRFVWIGMKMAHLDLRARPREA